MWRDAVEPDRTSTAPAARRHRRVANRSAPEPRPPPPRRGTIAACRLCRAGRRSLCGLKAWQLLDPCIAVIAPVDTQHAGTGFERSQKGDQLVVLPLVLRLRGGIGKEIALFG